jgi:hypothetical protein
MNHADSKFWSVLLSHEGLLWSGSTHRKAVPAEHGGCLADGGMDNPTIGIEFLSCEQL